VIYLRRCFSAALLQCGAASVQQGARKQKPLIEAGEVNEIEPFMITGDQGLGCWDNAMVVGGNAFEKKRGKERGSK
jgi:hypothetical protein